MTRLTLALVALGAALTPARAADWTQFRGPGGASVSDATGLPNAWTADTVRWKADLPGEGVSSPVTLGDRAFVTCSSGSKRDRLHVVCVSLKDGARLWERQIWATGQTQCHPMSAMAAPTPVVDADGVYALFATGDCVAYTLTGDLKWARSLAGDYPRLGNQVGMAASPALWKGTLLVPMDNPGDSFLAAVDTRYGKNIWRVKRPAEVNWTSPIVRERPGGTAEAIFPAGRETVAYDIATGQVAWKYESPGLGGIASASLVGDRLIVPAGGAMALDLAEKAVGKVAWKAAQLRTYMGSPMQFGDAVYSVNPAGVLVCVSAADGKVRWQERLKGKFSATPLGADGKLYVVNEDGVTFVVKPGEEKPEILGTNDLKDPILATPAVAGKTLLLRSRSALYAIGG